jgi:hypothetical protein
MNLEQAIHQRWAASAGLSALVPAERVTTGRSSQAGVPYATILRERARTALRTNAGDTLEEITLRIHVWHDDYDAGRSALDAVRGTFDRSGFALADGARVLQMRRLQETAVQHPDGMWQFIIRFLIYVVPSQA